MRGLNKIPGVFMVLLSLLSCGQQTNVHFGIIPQPVSIVISEGTFNLTEKTKFVSSLTPAEIEILQNAGFETEWTQTEETGAVNISVDTEMAMGEYLINIAPGRIDITAADVTGLFYGLQTLRQLRDLYGSHIPCAVIEDRPRMQYRSLFLDVSHHYFDVDFLKKQIDMMARLKMNRLTLLLASEGGWRFEVPQYPQLTQFGAFRPVESYPEWKESGTGFCEEATPGAYGGYYTPDDLWEIIRYARERFVEVIPALDFPCAHSNIAALFDSLDCGVNFGNRELEMGIIENILEELIAIFPTEYVYLGDGKASDPQSISCLECQPKVEKGKTGNINDSRYGSLLPPIEEFLYERGVKLMVWEESLRGVVSEDAAVIAWHSVDEAITVAEMGYDVIVAPSRYSSLDFYQTDPSQEIPSTMGFLPLEMMYNFEPLPRTLEKESASRVIGFQGNLWTYNITGENAAESKLYPRLLAVAELGWSMPERKSYPDFRRRVSAMLPILQKDGYRYFDIQSEVTGRAAAFEPVQHKASGKAVDYLLPFNRTYPGVGEPTLADGWRGGWVLDDGRWQGFFNNDMSVVVDLGLPTDITSVDADFIQHYGARIWLPAEVEIAVSNDGENYRVLGTIVNDVKVDERMFVIKSFAWKGKDKGRYIRYTARRNDRAGGWMFTDEVIIN